MESPFNDRTKLRRSSDKAATLPIERLGVQGATPSGPTDVSLATGHQPLWGSLLSVFGIIFVIFLMKTGPYNRFLGN